MLLDQKCVPTAAPPINSQCTAESTAQEEDSVNRPGTLFPQRGGHGIIAINTKRGKGYIHREKMAEVTETLLYAPLRIIK